MSRDGADRAAVVLGGDFREHFLLGRGQMVEGGNLGRPAWRDGPSGGARLATARPPPPVDPRRGSLPQREGQKGIAATGEAAAEPGLERGGAEETADDEHGDQRGIGGAEDAREEGIPGEVIGVLLLAQCLDEISAVGDKGMEEAEDLADASGVVARTHGPIGIGV
jgi:hypothetical protein